MGSCDDEYTTVGLYPGSASETVVGCAPVVNENRYPPMACP